MRLLSVETVKDNKDPAAQGRVLTEEGQWLSPLPKSGDRGFLIPSPGDHVVAFEDYYLGMSVAGDGPAVGVDE